MLYGDFLKVVYNFLKFLARGDTLPEGLWKGEGFLQISDWKVVIKFNDSTDAGGAGVT